MGGGGGGVFRGLIAEAQKLPHHIAVYVLTINFAQGDTRTYYSTSLFKICKLNLLLKNESFTAKILLLVFATTPEGPWN